MNITIDESHIDELINSLDEIHLYEPDVSVLTEEEYQQLLDGKYNNWEEEEK